jgi:hypothetical protein
MSSSKSVRRKSERRSSHAIKCKVTIILQKVANIPQDATEAQVTIALTDTVQESKLVSVDPASRSATWDNETIISTRCLFDREEGTKSLADIKASVTVKLSNVSR